MPEAVSPGPVVPQISHNNAVPNHDLIPMNLTAAQDKAFKREVMRHLDHSNVPINGPLTNWLDRYMPTKRAPQPTPYFERLCANRVARKARVDALMALHSRGDKHGRRWPRLHQIAEEEQKARHAAASKHKADVQACQEVAMAALVRKEERAAASAQGTDSNQIGFFPCHVAVPNIARVWYVLSSAGHRWPPGHLSHGASTSPDMIWEIAIASDSHTAASLPVMRQASSYAHWHANTVSPPWFDLGFFAPVLKPTTLTRQKWALVLPAMVNLRRLVVNHHVPLDPLRPTTYHLPPARILPELEEIGPALGPPRLRAWSHSQLPMLRSVKGRPEDVARLVIIVSMTSVLAGASPRAPHPRNYRPPALRSVPQSPAHIADHGAPPVAPDGGRAFPCWTAWLHLTLDEDLGWCRFNSRAVCDLREHTPVLKSVTLTCAPALGPLGSPHHDVPFLRPGRCDLAKLGPSDEEVLYATLDDHGPWDLDPKYA
ncbi:hypothetical protein FB451DRAFT_1422119 [Mycena latifolia]|nr:hypothetical protein FB451DRAFT_1422119 [Mycena latifolia]